MKRKNVAFDVTIVAPTAGLVTRIPANQIDVRAASVASNVRFDQGVARNAEGYGQLKLNPNLDGIPNLIFQGELAPKNGQRKIPTIIATAQRIWSVLRFPVGYAPPTLTGIINVADDQFKDRCTAMGVARFYITAFGSSASASTFFTYDSGSRLFSIEDTGTPVESNLLDVSAMLQSMTEDISYITFYLTNGSDTVFFMLTGMDGQVFLETSAVPDPPMVNSTLQETYSGGPQEVFVSNPSLFQFHITARVTFIPES